MSSLLARDDLSRFLVHLTRDYDGASACDNLLSILRQKRICARNAHCLFMYEFDRLRFSRMLRERFQAVCFTEVPLPQVKRLISKVARRSIKLKPYGLVFDRQGLLERGANPAIYINTGTTRLSQFLLKQFRGQFDGITTLRGLKDTERAHYEAIIQYYSLVNIIRQTHDFTWEREWRFTGDLAFKYVELVAIIAPEPEEFEDECKSALSAAKFQYVRRLPIISPEWSYEDIVEVMSTRIWNYAISQPGAEA